MVLRYVLFASCRLKVRCLRIWPAANLWVCVILMLLRHLELVLVHMPVLPPVATAATAAAAVAAVAGTVLNSPCMSTGMTLLLRAMLVKLSLTNARHDQLQVDSIFNSVVIVFTYHALMGTTPSSWNKA